MSTFCCVNDFFFLGGGICQGNDYEGYTNEHLVIFIIHMHPYKNTNFRYDLIH